MVKFAASEANEFKRVVRVLKRLITFSFSVYSPRAVIKICLHTYISSKAKVNHENILLRKVTPY